MYSISTLLNLSLSTGLQSLQVLIMIGYTLLTAVHFILKLYKCVQTNGVWTMCMCLYQFELVKLPVVRHKPILCIAIRGQNLNSVVDFIMFI